MNETAIKVMAGVAVAVLVLGALVGWLTFEEIRWGDHRWGLAKVRSVPSETDEKDVPE